MFSSPAEQSAVWQRSRTATDLEISTRVFLDNARANAEQVARHPPEKRVAYIGAALAAVKRPNRDAINNELWRTIALPTRMVAVMAGNLPRGRAELGLDTINAVERADINVALGKLIRELQQIQKLMYGGPLPKGA